MKTALKTLYTAVLLRPVVYFQLCSVRINLDGMLQARESVTDVTTRIRMGVAIQIARHRLYQLEARYIALTPVTSWRVTP